MTNPVLKSIFHSLIGASIACGRALCHRLSVLQPFAWFLLAGLLIGIPVRPHAALVDAGIAALRDTDPPGRIGDAVHRPLPYALHCGSLRQQLSQLTGVMVRFDQLAYLHEAAEAGELGLVGLLGQPPEDLQERLTALQTLSPTPVFFASDEESRSVQRLDSLIHRLPGTRSMTRAGSEEVTRIFREYGTRMRALGLHISFAPVADLGRGPGIGYRSFGSDAASVATMVNAVADGFMAGGILPVVKHFPGHGAASSDTHDGLATTPPLQQLSGQLGVFADVLTRDVAVMVGHLVTPELTQGLPASLSSAAIGGLLRQSLGFEGVVITDSLDMSAITDNHDQALAGVKAILAGADIALVSTLGVQHRLLDRLENAVMQGDLSVERVFASLERVLNAKNKIIGAGVHSSGKNGNLCVDPLRTSQSP